MGLGDLVVYICLKCSIEFSPEELDEDYCLSCERDLNGKGQGSAGKNCTK
jgi:hypothetical protein